MGPINYSIDVQQPFQAGMQGYQAGLDIRKIQEQRAAQEQAAIAQQQMQQDLFNLTNNPNASPAEFAAMTVKYPQLREQFKQASEMLQSEQGRGERMAARQAFTAMQTGRPELAAKVYRDRAAVLKANGAPAQEVQDAEFWAKSIETDPQATKALASLVLSVADNDFVKNYGAAGQEGRAQELQPSALTTAKAGARKSEAEATTAEVGAKFAEPKALLDLQEKGWNIEGIKADINYKKEQSRIAAMNAALNREGNDLKRQELQMKVNEAKSAFDEKARARVADVQSAAASMDNFLNSADRILAASLDENGKPNSTIRAMTGPIDSRLPTIQSDVADLEALVETLSSQAFLAQLPAMKGTGNLSNAEGDKLQASLTNLRTSQSANQLIANVKEAQRLILKARGNVETRYGIKAGTPDTPAVQTSPADIDALVKKYGGAK